jgi:hypothetical protein
LHGGNDIPQVQDGLLLAFAELVVDQCQQGCVGFLLFGPLAFDLDAGAEAGCQHHDAHDALGIDAPVIAAEVHLAWVG